MSINGKAFNKVGACRAFQRRLWCVKWLIISYIQYPPVHMLHGWVSLVPFVNGMGAVLHLRDVAAK
ncbi:hypothetical protein DXN05_06880 [Deminuibacter soli]|uniref:Uncharacterized protein n=1 Tax=Deminuibacter soli TaxID=2291815 RepID=A0A3E1NKR0_9BACT|nr:hypothetical protein DXN05_06880 [Deminuibacter soli]